MRVLYDGQIYTTQRVGGINRYFINLVSRLSADITPLLTVAQINELKETIYPSHTNIKVFPYQRFGFRPGRLSYWLEKYYFRIVTNYSNPDIIHPTYYLSLTRQSFEKVRQPTVITVWDMIHEIFSKEMDATGEYAALKEKAILAAQAIICISENTKKDLLEKYPTLEEKVFVTYLASEIDINIAYGLEVVPSRPYYLYVGGRNGYKNFEVLLSAFSKVVTIEPEIVICVAGAPFNHLEKQLISQFNLSENIEYYPYPKDAHLAKLYRCSIALVYPSLYEGFGIPPLEAMSCGTVVVASNSSSIPEVVGDAGLLFDPKSAEDLADILLFLYNHPGEREQLTAKGYERSKLFSWQKTADQTVKIYRSIANC